MKKLIAISVVFALAAGAAFAVDLGGTVIGTVNVIKADSADGSPVTAGGEFNRIRLEGSGEVADGKFGGWIRVNGFDTQFVGGDMTGHIWEQDTFRTFSAHGMAWWKPIDQLKVTIGGNPDNVFGKEGVSGWMFTQEITDTGVADGGANAWGGSIYGFGIQTRSAFYGGFGGNGLMLEVKPFDVIGVNLVLPFIDMNGAKAGDIFGAIKAQVDLNFSFGNIAITYDGGGIGSNGTMYGYFGLTAIDNLGLDFGLSYGLDVDSPFNIGLGFKYTIGAFAIKLRTVMSIPLVDSDNFKVLVDVLPYYAINDSLRIYVSAGLGINAPNSGDATIGWNINPYVEIGSEWGPKFYAGVKVNSKGGNDPVVNFAIPIAIGVGF